MSGAQQLLDLTGRTVLVTGASGGIGGAIAKKLAQAGARIILHCSHGVDRLEPFARETGAVKSIACDLSKEARIQSMIKGLLAEDLLPDLLVNNAAVQTLASISEADETVWQEINGVNLGGPYALTRHVSNALISKGRAGAFVNIASIEGLDPAENHAHYAAAKSALIMFTRASALELGKHNIRVNAVAPGLIERPGLQSEWPDGVKRWCERAPLSRLGTGEDVANAVLFLLSPAAVWISGNTLVVDGGMSTQNRW
ncbi:MAG TPA: SDR family oxidoreductase [Hellea balneolensis]|uniref:SDR family oxidoreductase n=1 Tax=Hellea balneolensis TaxID=287478 RepID=A0A7C5QVR7_9PROT|nr:SDR family oxidoreductase [Hellea balneolensis]